MSRSINMKAKDSMPFAYSWRTKAAIGVVLLMATLSVGTLAGYRIILEKTETDQIARDEQRFAELRRALPRRGVVGYTSDRGGGEDGVREYYRTQYFLAPLVVAPDTRRELVVANLSSPFTVAEFAAAHGLRVTQDFGNGMALLRGAHR